MMAQDKWDPHFITRFKGFEVLLPICQGHFFQDWPGVQDFNQWVKPLPIEFVQQTQGMDYLSEIQQQQRVPMRTHNWHDVFNNLTWLTFYQSKSAIIKRIKDCRHFVTQFDESGVIICSDDKAILDLIKNFQWQALFLETDNLLTHCDCTLFGHGLMDKLRHPFIGLTGKAILCQVKSDYFTLSQPAKNQFLDEMISDYLLSESLSTSAKALQPFPLLGWPTWYKPNQDPTFYQNTNYFRPGRKSGQENL